MFLSDVSIVNGYPVMLRAASPLVVPLAGGGGEAALGDQCPPSHKWAVCELAFRASCYSLVTLLYLPAHKNT